MQPDETLALDVSLDWGGNTRTTFGGTAPLKILEGKKHAKIGAIYNFQIWPQISLEWIKTSTSGKRRYQILLIPRWTKKIVWNFVHYEPSYKCSFWPTLSRIFSEDYISAPRKCCAPKFLHALQNDQVLLVHPPPGTGASLTIFFKGGSKIGLKFNKWALIT